MLSSLTSFTRLHFLGTFLHWGHSTSLFPLPSLGLNRLVYLIYFIHKQYSMFFKQNNSHTFINFKLIFGHLIPVSQLYCIREDIYLSLKFLNSKNLSLLNWKSYCLWWYKTDIFPYISIVKSACLVRSRESFTTALLADFLSTVRVPAQDPPAHFYLQVHGNECSWFIAVGYLDANNGIICFLDSFQSVLQLPSIKCEFYGFFMKAVLSTEMSLSSSKSSLEGVD